MRRPQRQCALRAGDEVACAPRASYACRRAQWRARLMAYSYAEFVMILREAARHASRPRRRFHMLIRLLADAICRSMRAVAACLAV